MGAETTKTGPTKMIVDCLGKQFLKDNDAKVKRKEKYSQPVRETEI